MSTLKKFHKSRNLASQSEVPKVQTDLFASNDCIVPRKNTNSTPPTKDLSRYPNCSKFTSLIAQKRFTDCLECLQNLGYEGDAAIFVLAFIQGGVV